MSFHASYSTWSWRLLSPIQKGGTSRYIEVGATWVWFSLIPLQICAFEWLQEILEAATKLTQRLENREGQDAADLKAHALTKELLLVFLLGGKDSNILLFIWVCLRNGDVFAKQTTQCIEIVQSNQSSWDCLSFAPLRCLESSSSASGNQSLGCIKSSIIFKQCVRLYSTVISITVKHFSSPNRELVPGLYIMFSKIEISA